MLPYLEKKLNVPDTDLFTRAACHIFADVLYASLSTEGFTFRRAALLKIYLNFPALHVYLGKGGLAFDVRGRQTEADCISRLQIEWTTPTDPADVSPFDCARDELFDPLPRDNDNERGLRNKWNLNLDADFVAACRQRAQAFIYQHDAQFVP
jgi:hypothetical protein